MIVVSSILAVTSHRIFRAAVYLLIVLLCTAGLYLLLNYHFLAVVQLSVYAGGILILFIFAILLTSAKGDRTEPHDKRRVWSGILASVAGLGITTWRRSSTSSSTATTHRAGEHETNMHIVGQTMMGTGKYEYLLSFETLSVLLLVCAIGGILIARKR